MQRHDWITEVLTDIERYASCNNLAALANSIPKIKSAFQVDLQNTLANPKNVISDAELDEAGLNAILNALSIKIDRAN